MEICAQSGQWHCYGRKTNLLHSVVILAALFFLVDFVENLCRNVGSQAVPVGKKL
jgi:hypothetical protein